MVLEFKNDGELFFGGRKNDSELISLQFNWVKGFKQQEFDGWVMANGQSELDGMNSGELKIDGVSDGVKVSWSRGCMLDWSRANDDDEQIRKTLLDR